MLQEGYDDFTIDHPAVAVELQVAIVSQPSKWLKFMTFQEGCFVIRNWMQLLKWSSWDFLSSLILQKMKEDNISQLGDYDPPFCEQLHNTQILKFRENMSKNRFREIS